MTNVDPIPEAELVWENEGGQLRLRPPHRPRTGPAATLRPPRDRNVASDTTRRLPPPTPSDTR